MDLFGKILVLINFGLSLVMAAVGGAVLYYRVDWSDAPAPPDGSAPEGELVHRIAKIKEVLALVRPAEAAWRDARATLLTQEDRRKKDQVWYVAELEHLRTGDALKNPILALVFDKGRTVPDPMNNNLPQMAPVTDRFGKALQSRTWYIGQQATVTADTTAVLDKIAKSVKEDADLTDRLNGSEKSRGLYQRAKDEQVKQGDIDKEMELVLLAEGQVRADSQLLMLRKRALEARVKELEKPGVAEGGR